MDNKASDSVNGKNEYVRAKPRDYNAERSVLGSMLLSPEAIPIAVEKLKAEDFYDITHQCRPFKQLPPSAAIVLQQWKNGEIGTKEACTLLDVPKTTFYRIVKRSE